MKQTEETVWGMISYCSISVVLSESNNECGHKKKMYISNNGRLYLCLLVHVCVQEKVVTMAEILPYTCPIISELQRYHIRQRLYLL